MNDAVLDCKGERVCIMWEHRLGGKSPAARAIGKYCEQCGGRVGWTPRCGKGPCCHTHMGEACPFGEEAADAS